MGSFSAVRSGFLTSLLNPKVTLFFLALFTQVISPETPLSAKAAYGLTVVGIEFGWFALVALFVSSAPVRRHFDAASHWAERATGAFLIALGVRLQRWSLQLSHPSFSHREGGKGNEGRCAGRLSGGWMGSGSTPLHTTVAFSRASG